MKRDHEQANKDNNFIYNDLVPDFNTLEPPGKATLAKAVQFTSPAPNFQDLFKDLMPLAVSQAMSAYNTKKEEFVTTELERLRDATHNLNEYVRVGYRFIKGFNAHSCLDCWQARTYQRPLRTLVVMNFLSLSKRRPRW